MDFTGVIWWAYPLTVLAGIGIGLLQSVLLRRAALNETPKRWMFAVKTLLWLAALALMALVSIPLLLVFVLVASLTYLIVSLFFIHQIRKEGMK
jgi:hypothetical protein